MGHKHAFEGPRRLASLVWLFAMRDEKPSDRGRERRSKACNLPPGGGGGGQEGPTTVGDKRQTCIDGEMDGRKMDGGL